MSDDATQNREPEMNPNTPIEKNTELREQIHQLFFNQSLEYPVDSSDVRSNLNEAMQLIKSDREQAVRAARISELERLLHPDLWSYESRAEPAIRDRIAELSTQSNNKKEGK
jgi:hypothetical protein